MIDVTKVRTSVERLRSALSRIVHGPPPVQWVDVGAAAAIFFLGASQIIQRSPSWWQTNLLLVPACVALVLVRRSPVLLGTLVAAAGVALIVTDEAQSLSGLSLIVAATYVCARTARFNWPVVLPVLVAAVFSTDTGYAPLAAALVGTALGVARQSHAAASWLQQRASTLEDITEDQRATQVGLEERNTLARELHDIVGHHVTAVVVLAEAAQAGTEPDPAVLPRIADTARAALGELDTLVASLRQADGVPETTAASRLVDVPELLGPLEHAGINAAVHVEISSQVGEGLQLTAYRIIQECLTNVMRHAYAHTVRVVVAETDGRIEITVDDDGAGFDPEQVSRGRGLVGIGERVSGHGGTWSVSPSPSGGSRVRVQLPLARATGATPFGGHLESGWMVPRARDVLLSSRQQKTYTPEQRRRAARLVIDTGRPIADVAAELGVGEQLLRRWVAREQGRKSPERPLDEDERAELARLRVENLDRRPERSPEAP
jgi:signal transduction histidine kinase/transposase-like protein